jgi:hypothetical protein
VATNPTQPEIAPTIAPRDAARDGIARLLANGDVEMLESKA